MLTTRSNICHDPGPGVIITLADVTPRVSHVTRHMVTGNNNIKCLLSLSPKTNLIIPRANNSLASNMGIIFPLSLSKVNTRVVSQLGNAEHSSCFYLTVFFKKVPSSSVSALRVPNPGCAGNIPIIIVSLVISWPLRVISPGPPGHKYYRVIVAEINYHRLREDGRFILLLF